MSTSQTIAFIGAGNMASAIIGGMLDNRHNADNIWVSAPDNDRLQQFGERFGVNVTTDNDHCARQADLVVLAVKPQVMRDVCKALAPAVQKTRPVIVSIAAGLQTATLNQWLGGGLALVRCMPNTPSLVGQGAAGLFATEGVKAEQKKAVAAIFDSVGIAVWVDEEELLLAVTAVAGSAPAYFFLMLEALEEACSEMGLEAATARSLAIQTMGGAAEMARRGPDEPAQLKQNVMSPGGATEQAIKTYEDGDFRGLVKKACQAVVRRSGELSDELSGGSAQ